MAGDFGVRGRPLKEMSERRKVCSNLHSDIKILTSSRGQVDRNGSGQAHFTAKMPVRKEGGTSARLSILYGVPVVKRMNTISHSLNRTI
jgi:hypothetical protein